MKDYLCIAAFLIASLGLTMAISGCGDTKVTQSTGAGQAPIVVVLPDGSTEDSVAETIPK